jgi:Tfp pilus assembly protein PilO
MYAKPEFSSINETKAQIKTKESALNDIKQKNERISSLIQNLDANKDKEDLVLSYLPNSKEEELIVSSVFQSVVNSSIYLSNLGIVYQEKPFNISPQFENSQPGDLPGGSAADASLPAGPTNINIANAKLSMVGTYENIKTFLNQVFTIEKESNISSIKIYKNQSSDQVSGEQPKAGSNVNNLNAEVSVSFDNVPSLKLKKDEAYPAFSKSSFDFSVTDDITKLFNRKAAALEIGSAGKSNPFLP